MKLVLSAVLPLFFQCASSAPVPATSSHRLLLRVVATEIHLDTQSATLSKIHSARYPSTRDEEEAFKTLPYTPPEGMPVPVELASRQPLPSAYLLSLSSSAPTSTKFDTLEEDEVSRAWKELAAKPTSALPSLRKEDLKRYWASKGARVETKSNEVSETTSSLQFSGDDILLPGNVYIKSHNMSQKSDIIVVGVVLLFLVLVLAVEGAEKICESYKRWFSNSGHDDKHGAIYLDCREAVTFVARK